MGTHHLISIDEDELRNWRSNEDDLFRNIGTAIVLVCLDPERPVVSVREDSSGEAAGAVHSTITVKHVSEHECSNFRVWAWESGDEVCVADLPDSDLRVLRDLIYAIQRERSGGSRDAEITEAIRREPP